MNIGWNRQGQPNQLAAFGQTVKYQWYAGKIERDAGGTLAYTPVEFGSLNLFPSDQMFQNFNGLFGAMIIEPPGSTWQCGDTGSLANCDPSAGPPPTTRASATVTLPDATKFREFALMISDDIRMIDQDPVGAVNYRTEPWQFRYAGNGTTDFSCMLSNQLRQPQTIPKHRSSRLRLETRPDSASCIRLERARLRSSHCMVMCGSEIRTGTIPRKWVTTAFRSGSARATIMARQITSISWSTRLVAKADRLATTCTRSSSPCRHDKVPGASSVSARAMYRRKRMLLVHR